MNWRLFSGFLFFVFSRFEPNDFFSLSRISEQLRESMRQKPDCQVYIWALKKHSVAWFYTKTCRRKQPTFWDATIGFPRNEFWATSAFCTTQIWVLHYPYHANSLMTFLFFINCFRKGRERRVEPEGHEPVILRYVYIELHRPPPTERRILYQAKFPANVPRGYTKFFFECWDIFQHEKRIFKRGACNVLFMIFC